MYSRRKFVSSVISLGSMAALSGCSTNPVKGKFKLVDIGLAAQSNEVVAFVEVKNISQSQVFFSGLLSVFDGEAQLSEWWEISDGVRAGATRRLYVSFDVEDVPWASKDTVDEVVESYTARVDIGDNTEQIIYGSDDVGVVM